MAVISKPRRTAEATIGEEAGAVEEDTDLTMAEAVVVLDSTARTPASKASGMASTPRSLRLVLSIRMRRPRSPPNQRLHISISSPSSRRTVHHRGPLIHR